MQPGIYITPKGERVQVFENGTAKVLSTGQTAPITAIPSSWTAEAQQPAQQPQAAPSSSSSTAAVRQAAKEGMKDTIMEAKAEPVIESFGSPADVKPSRVGEILSKVGEVAVEAAMPANAVLNDLNVSPTAWPLRIPATVIDAASNYALFSPAAPVAAGYKGALMSVKPLTNVAKLVGNKVGQIVGRKQATAVRQGLEEKIIEIGRKQNAIKPLAEKFYNDMRKLNKVGNRVPELTPFIHQNINERAYYGNALKSAQAIFNNELKMANEALDRVIANPFSNTAARVGAGVSVLPLRIAGNEMMVEPTVEYVSQNPTIKKIIGPLPLSVN